MKIAIENVGTIYHSPLEAARYVDEFEAPDAVGWHLDLGNLIVYGWPSNGSGFSTNASSSFTSRNTAASALIMKACGKASASN